MCRSCTPGTIGQQASHLRHWVDGKSLSAFRDVHPELEVRSDHFHDRTLPDWAFSVNRSFELTTCATDKPENTGKTIE